MVPKILRNWFEDVENNIQPVLEVFLMTLMIHDPWLNTQRALRPADLGNHSCNPQCFCCAADAFVLSSTNGDTGPRVSKRKEAQRKVEEAEDRAKQARSWRLSGFKLMVISVMEMIAST